MPLIVGKGQPLKDFFLILPWKQNLKALNNRITCIWQQTHFHSYKHCLLQLTHQFISSKNNQSFLSYYEKLKQGEFTLLIFFFYPLFKQHVHTNLLYDYNFEQNVLGSQDSNFFPFQKKKTSFAFFTFNFLKTVVKKTIIGLLS